MKKVRQLVRCSFFGSAAVLVLGCAKHDLIKERLRTSAPKNASDLGVVLDNAKPIEIQNLLAAHPNAQVRVLNQEHGLFEVFGVSESEAKMATKGTAKANIFFQTSKQPLATPFSVAGPVGVKIGSLNPCSQGIEGSGPIAQLKSTAPLDLADSTIEIGTQVKLSGVNPSRLKSVIMVMGPDSSLTPEQTVDGDSFEFNPDALGLYQAFVIVQDKSNVCAMDGLRFIVTANRPYQGPKASDVTLDLSSFDQLKAVSAAEAWKVSQGEGVVVAVIDTGVNYNHPSLAPNILLNDKEIADNGLDDDGNGFVDDVLGYDFINGDAYPYDDDSHGTHVSGLAASRQFGLAPHAKILAIKALTSIGGDAGTIAAAIRYAVDRGAKIINMSLGAPGARAHPALKSAMDYAEKNNVLVVVAAGNGDAQTGLGFDIDQQTVFPASLPNDNLISVASFDADLSLSVYSNFGKVGVDVVAPGGGENDPLISAAFENPHHAVLVGMSGTSMAAPVVSGIAADMMAANPRLSAVQIKALLIQAGPVVSDLKDVTVSSRHIDAFSAIELSLQQNALF